jgi:hypothetical protein
LNSLVVISWHTPWKCVRVLVGTMSIRLSEDNHDSWVTCTSSAECKTVITVMLTVMSGMDPHISEVLHEAKTRYLEVHKLLYAVLIASRKLHHYFQAHRISVVSSYPLRAILHNPNAIGNIAQWAVELAKFELDFASRHVIKS